MKAVKTITQVQRHGRREGHPCYRVTFSDGTDAITKAGAQINYGITNSDYRGAEVEATFDGNLLIGVVRTDGAAPLGAV